MNANSFYFVASTWYYPDNDDCYEEIDQELGPMALPEVSAHMHTWLVQHPDAFIEGAGDCVGIRMTMLECSDTIKDKKQSSARIEV